MKTFGTVIMMGVLLTACQAVSLKPGLNLPGTSTGALTTPLPETSNKPTGVGATSNPLPSVAATASPSTIQPPEAGLEAYYAFEGETKPYSYPALDKGLIESQNHSHDGYFVGPLTFSYFEKGVRGKTAEFASSTDSSAGVYFDKSQGVHFSGAFSISVWTLVAADFVEKYSMPLVCVSDTQAKTSFAFLWSPGGPDMIFDVDAPQVFWPHRGKIPRPELQKVAQWHHTAFTYDGKSVRLYLDGRLDTSIPYSRPTAELGVVTEVGKCLNLTSMQSQFMDIFNNFYGDLDELRFYSRVLNDAEVKTLYDLDKSSATYQQLRP